MNKPADENKLMRAAAYLCAFAPEALEAYYMLHTVANTIEEASKYNTTMLFAQVQPKSDDHCCGQTTIWLYAAHVALHLDMPIDEALDTVLHQEMLVIAGNYHDLPPAVVAKQIQLVA